MWNILNVFSLLFLISFIGIVFAPPPLAVELEAEKEEIKHDQEKNIYIDSITNEENIIKEYVLNQIRDEVHSLQINDGDLVLSEGVRIIEDPKEIKELTDNKRVNKGEIVEEFSRIELPTNFNEYDLNSDGFIDLDELIGVTEARENAKAAFGDSDTDGDGKISREEFSYWFSDGNTIDISDELNNYEIDDNDDEYTNDTDEADEIDADDEENDDDDLESGTEESGDKDNNDDDDEDDEDDDDNDDEEDDDEEEEDDDDGDDTSESVDNLKP